MEEFSFTKTFNTRESFGVLEQRAKLYKLQLEEAVKICGFDLQVIMIELEEYYASHRYPEGFEVRLDCENELQYTAIKLVL